MSIYNWKGVLVCGRILLPVCAPLQLEPYLQKNGFPSLRGDPSHYFQGNLSNHCRAHLVVEYYASFALCYYT